MTPKEKKIADIIHNHKKNKNWKNVLRDIVEKETM